MPPIIDSVTPDRVRPGDRIVVQGSGFSPSFDNRLSIGGILVPLETDGDLELSGDVPVGVEEDTLIGVIVTRIDSQESSDAFMVWSRSTLAALRDRSIPGQVPGPREAFDLTATVADVAQAQDYERAATHAEHQRGIAKAKGSLVTTDGATLLSLPVGGGGQVLEASAAEALNVAWRGRLRKLALSWGKEINAAGSNDGPMVAGASSDKTSSTEGEHGVAFSGTADRLWVYVQEAGADTLDQVQLLRSGAIVHDSGAGLALGVLGLYSVTLTVAVVQGQRLELRAFKAGAAAIMRLVGGVRLVDQELVEAADTLEVVDAIMVELVGLQLRSVGPDQLAVTDSLTVEQSI